MAVILGYFYRKNKKLQEKLREVKLELKERPEGSKPVTSLDVVVHPLAHYVVIPKKLLDNTPKQVQSDIASAILHIKTNQEDYEADGYYYCRKIDPETKKFIQDKYTLRTHTKTNRYEK